MVYNINYMIYIVILFMIYCNISWYMMFCAEWNIEYLKIEIKASDPKWVNSILDIIGVNSLKLGDLQMSIHT